MKRELLFILLGIVAIHVFHSCAQIGQIEGGPRDSIPPQWIASRPLNYTTNFDEKRVKLYFDEYFKINDQDKKFVISPPTKEAPDLKVWSRRLTVKLPDSLKENTTYTLQFADAIADYTENNPMEGLTFVFSTGDVIDTMAVGGHLYDARTLEPQEGVFVAVYEEMQDSTPYHRLPDYVAKTDTAGRFFISHIHPARYHVFALNDLNRNTLFDMPSEQIAYLDTMVEPRAESIIAVDSLISATGERDSVVTRAETMLYPNHIQLFLFEEEHRQPYISEYKRERPHQIRLTYNRLLDDKLDIKLIEPVENDKQDWFVKEPNATNDTITLWITDTSIVSQDTLLLSADYNTLDSIEQIIPRTDTLKIAWRVPETGADSTNFIEVESNISDRKLEFGESIYFYAEQWIEGFDKKYMHLYELLDSTVNDPRIQKLQRYQRPTPDSLIFWFERPLPEEPYFSSASKEHKWFDYSLDASRKKAYVHVLDTAVSNRDTIKMQVHFSNLYYNDAIVQDRKALDIPYSMQKVIKAERLEDNHCVFYLDKITSTPFTIEGAHSPDSQSWIQKTETSQRQDSLRVDFWVDAASAQLNNLFVNVTMNDRLPNGNDTTVILPIGFIKTKQALVEKQRIDSTALEFKFELPLLKIPELTPLNFRSRKNWFEASFSSDSTVFTAKLLDNKNIEQDTLRLKLAYTYLDSLQTETLAEKTLAFYTMSDSLRQRQKFVRDSIQNAKLQEEEEQQEQEEPEYEVTTLNKIPFDVERDKEQLRKFWLKAELAPEKKYRLRMDSMALFTPWETYNDSVSTDFVMKGEDEYGTIQLEVQNYPPNAILEVMGKKGERVIRQIGKITSNKITIELLLPTEYQLRIIDDRNGNGKWDTGNFLQKLQPERVYRYNAIINVKEGWTMEENWDLTNDEKSFGPVEEEKKKKAK